MKRTARLVGFVGGLSVVAVLYSAPFLRGDANQSGSIDLGDGISALMYLFAGGTTTCEDALDANDSGTIDLSDPIGVLMYLFAGGTAPAPPFPDCGDDAATPDGLDCAAFDTEICPAGPAECFSEADVGVIVDEYLGQSICLPSPAYEGTVEEYYIVACPEGCCTCTGGAPGCEVTIAAADVDVDLTTGTLSASLTAEAEAFVLDVTTTISTAHCTGDIAITGTVTGTFTLEPTEWENVYTFGQVTSLTFTVDDLSMTNVSGGLICNLLAAGAGLLAPEVANALNESAPEFIASIEEALAGAYICP